MSYFEWRTSGHSTFEARMSVVIGKIEVLADQTSRPLQGIEVDSAIRPFVGDDSRPDFEVSRQDRSAFRGNASEAETALSAATCSLADQTGRGQGMRTSNLSFFLFPLAPLHFSLPLSAPLSRLKGPSTHTSAHRTSEPDGRTRQGEHELSKWEENSNKKKPDVELRRKLGGPSNGSVQHAHLWARGAKW